MTTQDEQLPKLEVPDDDGARKMPFSRWLPVLIGAGIGVALRLVFGGAPGGGRYEAMSWVFIYLAPVLVGAVTVYAAERQVPRTAGYCFRAGALANLLFVLGTMAVLIEGLICAVIIVPLFMVLGGFAGMLMGFFCRKLIWPRATLYSLAALPLALGALVDAAPPPREIERIERSIVIAAAPAAVWQQIRDVRDIRPEEVQQGWMYRIGVPLPQSGVTQDTEHGRVRKITMGKQIHFEQVEQERHENRHVRWTYRFDKDSIPAGALDDHVMIGGHYFDLIDTAYTLTPLLDGATRLDINMGYRVSTDFNWYARPVASLLIGNFEDVILKFYARRAEHAPGRARAALRSVKKQPLDASHLAGSMAVVEANAQSLDSRSHKGRQDLLSKLQRKGVILFGTTIKQVREVGEYIESRGNRMNNEQCTNGELSLMADG